MLLSVVFLLPIQKNDYLQAYKLKCELLEKTESPRIIFVGGSNLAFGLDSQRIKDSLQINVINYGLHAGIGLKFMIDDVTNYLRKDDIVVIAPEYSHFYNGWYGEASTLAPIQSIAGWKKLHLLNLKQILIVIEGLPRIVEFIRPKSYGERSYVLSGFNEFGDEVKHWNLESISIPESAPISASFNEEFASYFINKVSGWKNQIGCKVLMVPPICIRSSYDAQKESVDEVANYLKRSGYPFLIHPIHHALPDEYAYDTNYHMNYDGVQIFTSSMIGVLKNEVLEK